MDENLCGIKGITNEHKRVISNAVINKAFFVCAIFELVIARGINSLRNIQIM